jgi:hypothetical protein
LQVIKRTLIQLLTVNTHVPLVQDPPTSLEASLPAPPRKPRNVARKRVDKKLKVTETTSQEVSFLKKGSRVLVSRCNVLTMKLHCLQEILPSDPVELGAKATGIQWESRLEVAVAQPPPWRNSWRN